MVISLLLSLDSGRICRLYRSGGSRGSKPSCHISLIIFGWRRDARDMDEANNAKRGGNQCFVGERKRADESRLNSQLRACENE
jgi:hypothetical protein